MFRIGKFKLLLSTFIFVLLGFTDKKFFADEQRASITFILGKDKKLENPYYSEAEKYYKYNPIERTDYIVNSCYSLLEVRNYLETNRPFNQLPWGRINLVSHGNQWTGLSVAISPNYKRTTSENIDQSIANGFLKELSDSIVDDKTEIFIHGCGIGNDKNLLKTIKRALGGEGLSPDVYASRLFEHYISQRTNNGNIKHIRYLANVWYAYFKMGYRPSDKMLIAQLKSKYPNDSINWQDILKRENPRWVGDSYHYVISIPVIWIVKYKSWNSLPDLSSTKNQQKWIYQQQDMVNEIKKTNIPLNKFRWTFRNIKYISKNQKKPAIMVKGYCSILCVLKPVLANNADEFTDGTAYLPPINDTLYYSRE